MDEADVAKLVAAIRYVDTFFPDDGNTEIWHKENAEAIAIARGYKPQSATKACTCHPWEGAHAVDCASGLGKPK